MEFSGEAAAVFVTTETPSGGLLLAGHFYPRRITGTDELGRRYVATGATMDMTFASPRAEASRPSSTGSASSEPAGRRRSSGRTSSP